MKKVTIIFLVFTSLGISLYAESPAPLYHHDFEGKTVPKWKIWAKNVEEPCKINFVGPSSDKSHTGKKSLKFDLTFQDGTYCYWQGKNIKVAATGDLKISGYIFVEQIPEGVNVSVGRNISFPPSGSSGISSSEIITTQSKEWEYFEIEIGDNTAEYAEKMLGTDKVFRYIDRVAVMFRGKFKPGQRAVVYLDDLKITGKGTENYEKEMVPLVEAEHKRQLIRLGDWRKRFEAGSAPLKAQADRIASLPDFLRNHVSGSAAAITELSKKLILAADTKLNNTYWVRKKEEAGWQEGLDSIQSAIPNLEPLLKYCEATPDRKNIIYTRQAITDQFLLPQTLPVAAAPGHTIKLIATPDEYEPATFAIFAGEAMEDVTLKVSPLKSGGDVMDSSVLDLHTVKVWYQGNPKSIAGYTAGGKRYLVPELLLKDDDLIRVDYEKERNFMRHGENAEYVDISDPDVEKMTDVIPRDSAELKPFTIPANSLKQVWITAHIPDDAKEGNYKGTIQIFCKGKDAGIVNVKLRVLPFKLEPCPHVHSFYHHSRLNPNKHRFQMNCNYRNEAQLETELRNMNEHGVTSPVTYQEYGDHLIKVLEMRKRVGMPANDLFTIGQRTGNSTDPKRLARTQEKIKEWIKLAKEYGYKNVYVYGFDEAKGEKMKSQRIAWKSVRETGARTFAAGYYGSFEAVGDLQDLIIMPHKPDPEEAKKYHRIGHKIFSYANPQCGPEVPETFRRNYGLLLWKSNFDGAMDYAYHRGFGHVWNDFDSEKYRDHVMAYPSVDGVIDTLHWEGYREAVDDTRYLATLQKRIAAQPKAKNALAAIKWLAELDIDGDLYTIREGMIDWILKLTSSE